MTTALNDEGRSDPLHGEQPTRAHPPLPADTVDLEPARRGRPSVRRRARRRIRKAVAVGVVVGLLVAVLAPPVNQAIDRVTVSALSQLFGTDHPIELSPICGNLGGILAPPPEMHAAYQYRCANSRHAISRGQIFQRCISQWGRKAQLELRDPDSASGWTCHTPGLLS
jgi:hypothetical protein